MPPTLPIHVGQVVGGKYRIEAAIGRGGMGAVYRATHIQLLQRVALKVLLPGIVDDLPDAVQRFLREARASARLGSEYVAKVVDVDAEGAMPYMAMEYLEGTDLSKQLKERTRFSISDSIAYALDVCAALVEAHALGIIHRDLKPQNMFLTRRSDGRPIVKVLDFGISKISGAGLAGTGAQDLTGSQMVLGSPRYMSPEQMRATKLVDGRTDIWSLGVCLYEFLTGSIPFEAPTTFELGAMVLTMDPPPPSQKNHEIPAELDAVVLRCLQKNPEMRFGSIAELAAALRPFASAAALINLPPFPVSSQLPGPGDATVSLPTGFAPFPGVTPSRPSFALAQAPAPAPPEPAPPLYGMQMPSAITGAQTSATWVEKPAGVAPNQRALAAILVVLAIGILLAIGRVVAQPAQAGSSSGTAMGSPTLPISASVPLSIPATSSGQPTSLQTASVALSATASATASPLPSIPSSVPTPKPSATAKKPTSTAPPSTVRPALPNER